MPTERAYSTELLPLLARGKHRRARKGACFMEFASYLAGERWSDHPACTHPLLAVLARHVNDYISDDARQALVGLVPDVIGLTGSDLRIDVRIALRAARTALPVVAEERQAVMATAMLTCERLLADLDGRPGTPMSQQSRDALAQVPGAAVWARRFTRNIAVSVGRSVDRPPRRSSVTRSTALRGPAFRTLIDCCTTCWSGRSKTARHGAPRTGPARPLTCAPRRRPDRAVQRRRSRRRPRSSPATRNGRGPPDAGRRNPVRDPTCRRSERSECCCGLTLCPNGLGYAAGSR
jgi:hypothetical protein